MKKLSAMILALVLVFSLTACGSSSANLRFVTGGESGTYYGFGSVLAQHATNNAGIKVTGLVGNGSQSNINELKEGNAELAFCQSDVMAYAYNGTNLFDTPITNFSTVAALYTEQVQIVTLDASIKTVADLKGKKVSIGAAGSGVYFNAIDILNAAGIDIDDIKPQYQSFEDSKEALKDGRIDAAFIVSGTPTTAITELATTNGVNLISIDEELQEKILSDYSYYKAYTIPAGTYPDQDEDIQTVAVEATLIVSADVDEETVYNLTAAIFDHVEDIKLENSKGGELTLESATDITTVPYHAGAAKYFAEKGYTVNTDEN